MTPSRLIKKTFSSDYTSVTPLLESGFHYSSHAFLHIENFTTSSSIIHFWISRSDSTLKSALLLYLLLDCRVECFCGNIAMRILEVKHCLEHL